ncbi:MAG: hypothetical protein K2G51_09360 [Lachnospiraceae bacterium]|nr:hypothetical protein [Lachnospiraceae bacterium]
MRQRLILLFILLSTLLYGCSAQLRERDTATPPVIELPVIEESGTKQVELSTEALREDHSALSTETEANPAPVSSADTADIDDISSGAVSQPEEGMAAADNGHYSAATDIPSAEVERYASQVRQQFLEHDWTAVSSEIAYPVTISGVTYHSSADFLDASGGFDSNLDETFFAALESEDCVEMFCSYEGIMLGESGQVWIAEVLNDDLTSQGLKIIAVNGLFR